jgi:hypothetical protein
MAAARDMSACAARAIFAATRAGKALERFHVQPEGGERVADIVGPLRRWRRVYRGEDEVPHGYPLFESPEIRLNAWLLGIAPLKRYDHESGLSGQYPLV